MSFIIYSNMICTVVILIVISSIQWWDCMLFMSHCFLQNTSPPLAWYLALGRFLHLEYILIKYNYIKNTCLLLLCLQYLLSILILLMLLMVLKYNLVALQGMVHLRVNKVLLINVSGLWYYTKNKSNSNYINTIQ